MRVLEIVLFVLIWIVLIIGFLDILFSTLNFFAEISNDIKAIKKELKIRTVDVVNDDYKPEGEK